MGCKGLLLLACAAFSVCIIIAQPYDNDTQEVSLSEEMAQLISTLKEDYSLRLTQLEEQLGEQANANSEMIEDLQRQMSDVQAELTSTQRTLQSTQTALISSQARFDKEMSVLQSDIQNLTSEQGRCGCGSVAAEAATTAAPPVVLNEICRPERHSIIDNDYRLTSYGEGNICDRGRRGFYRFMVNGANAIIPTSCVRKYSCGTSGPLWLDLQGQAMPALGQEVSARACESWDNSCCLSNAPVTVVNCDSFYIYHLQFPNTNCDVGYCVERQS